MIDEDWRGFTAAFSQAVRPDDSTSRSGKRMLSIGFAVVVVSALGALMYGALGGGTAVAKPSEVGAIAPAPTAAPGNAAPGTTWTDVAGPTCASDTTSGFAAYGYYTGVNSDQTTGWSSSAKGGYSGGSCTGGYLSVPVSGQTKSYDSDRFALWKFDFSATFSSASCTLSTYVPNSTDRASVGGDPAYYYYFQTDYEPGATDELAGEHAGAGYITRDRLLRDHLRTQQQRISVVVVGGEARFSGIALAPQHEGRPLRGSI